MPPCPFRCQTRALAVLLGAALSLVLLVASDAHSPHDHIEAFELGPGEERTGTVMLIVVRGNLWRSEDRGASWKRIVRGLDNRHEIASIACEVLGDETAWYLKTRNDGIVYQSFDQGRSWSRAKEGELFPGDEDPIDFEPAGEGLTDKRITSVLRSSESEIFVATWNDGVFFSGDGGATWEQRAKGLTTDPQGDRRGLPQFTTLRWASGNVLFLAGYDGLFRSGDEGRQWTEVETLPETLLIDFDVWPGSEQAELLAITYWKGAFHSPDSGNEWRPVTANLAPSKWDHLKRKLKGDDESAQIARFHSISFSPDYGADGTIYGGLRNWFLISDDAGQRWEQIELPPFAEGEDVIPDRIVYSDRFSEDRILYFCARVGEGKTRGGGVFRSTDGGRTFDSILKVEGKYMQSLAISPAFTSDATVFVSSARGNNNSEIYRTTDGGETWRVATGGMQFVDYGAELAISPDFENDRMIWAGTELGLWRSSDAGERWERVQADIFSADGFVDMVAISPDFAVDRTMLVTVKGEGNFLSRDGGKSFESFRPDLFEANHQFNRLWSYSPGRLVKFSHAEGDLYAMTGEEIFKLGKNGGVSELNLREIAVREGKVSLATFWVAVGAGVAVVMGMIGFWFRRRIATT